MITSITPNFDERFHIEAQDEHRNKSFYPVIMWAAIFNPANGMASITPVGFIEKEGKLLIGGDKLVLIKKEPNGV